MLAERLGIAALTGARKLTVDGAHADRRAADRRGLRGRHRRHPGRGLRLGHHQRAALPVLQGHHGRQEEAGADAVAGRPGHRRRTRWASAGATSAVVEHAKRPPRSGGTKVTDEGDGGAKLVEFLATEKFV